jgi:ferredoxin-NADP reductase
MTEQHIVKILHIENVTHDVKCFRVEKPRGYSFVPGQATEVAINSEKWKNKKRPFTFTCLNTDHYLEFTIKIYPSHDGVTNALDKLKKGDELIIHDVWGAISYKGPGVFIAGGAGITPFISILRQLKKDKLVNGNQLIFSNKLEKDIILKEELGEILGAGFINVVTQENIEGYHHGRIDKKYLEDTVNDFTGHFYVCGPATFVSAITYYLEESGVKGDTVVIEK